MILPRRFLASFVCLLAVASFCSPARATSTNGKYYVAVSEDAFDKLAAAEARKDTAAIQKLREAQQIYLLKAGIGVSVVKRKSSGSVVKIHIAGTMVEVWCVIEELQ